MPKTAWSAGRSKANMPFSINIIGGSAGPQQLQENTLASAAFCNEVKPGLIYFMPLQADQGSRLALAVAVEKGKFRKSNLGDFFHGLASNLLEPV